MTSNDTQLPARPAPAALNRADEVEDLVNAVKDLLVPFVRSADEDAAHKSTGHGLQMEGKGPRTALVEHHPPHKLDSLFGLDLPTEGQGKDGLLGMIQKTLNYSVNTWDQGFLDKLYGSTNAVGVVSEMLLASLNTNVHVYQVSPALTVVEKNTSKALAELFGLSKDSKHAGGVSQPGGSASNSSSIIVARNTLYPDTKLHGLGDKKFVLFTSAHGHYSVEKAAQIMGFGSSSVISVGVDEEGRMRPDLLDSAIEKAKEEGKTPFYVNATAGTTVLGSFDPFNEIANVCQKHNCWMHIDGSWGGPVIFSNKHKSKLAGCHRADSIAVTPHKMLAVPMTCSFLLAKDMRKVQRAMTLPAGYLFHNSDDTVDEGAGTVEDASTVATEDADAHPGTETKGNVEIWDLADLTPQCGRRGDALKLALSWIYHGSSGFEKMIDTAYETAAYFAEHVRETEGFTLVSSNPPPCWQVCFYYGKQDGTGHRNRNSKITETVARQLIPRSFMIDYAPGEDGKFFRVVVNGGTRKETVEGLVKAIKETGEEVVKGLKA